jgi:hypothetical protein
MDQAQTPGSTPPSDTPPPAGPPAVGETPPAPETPATPVETPAVPAESPATPSETPAAPTVPAETPAPPSEPAAPTDGTTQQVAAPASDAAAGATPTGATPAPSDPPAHNEHKGVSKPIMVTVGLLMIGAFSAVFLVANMKPGDTQSSAKKPVTTKQTPPVQKVVTTSPVSTDPNLIITSPVPNTVVTTAAVSVTGKTFPNAEVYVNDTDTVADATGLFSATVTLEDGENVLSISANDTDGNVAEQEIIVTYDE